MSQRADEHLGLSLEELARYIEQYEDLRDEEVAFLIANRLLTQSVPTAIKMMRVVSMHGGVAGALATGFVKELG